MAFVCFECHMANQQDGRQYLAEMMVARDAELDGRTEESIAIRLRASAMIRGSADYHIAVKLVGEIGPWPGVQVWLPGPGVSVGPCEDCDSKRPCVNV
jgi:hypothetical protein